ncbi:MAG: branched-chain-amino-acid transaminase [Pseudomonadales bacterium]|nr:branched-chain-amino-acid transaminase [Pseudomonadales bacterium]
MPDFNSSLRSEKACWINGRIVAPENARISVYDHGLLYGDGVFEGLRFYAKRCFRIEQHLQRLCRSAQATGLVLPLDQTQLIEGIKQTIYASSLQDGYVRLLVTRGEGPLGLDPTPCTNPNVIIMVDRLSIVPPATRKHGAAVIIASTRRLNPDGLDPRIKSLNYLNHILARMEASHAGADEAILLNNAGRVAEGSADNIFIVHDQKLITPPVTEGALDGITRQCMLELAAQVSLKPVEQPIAAYDLYNAEECFLTGTGAELIPVAAVDGRKIRHCPGKYFEGLNKAYTQLTKQELLAEGH